MNNECGALESVTVGYRMFDRVCEMKGIMTWTGNLGLHQFVDTRSSQWQTR